LETFAYAASQFIALYLLARVGTGAISANSCATRIGMLGFSLLSQPLTLFMQARLCCVHGDEERKGMIRKYLAGMALCTLLSAALLVVFRKPVIELIYLRGHVSADALEGVAAMLPAWLGYFVVLSMNAVSARYLFTVSMGARYARHMLVGYALTNGLRLITAGRVPASWIIWCAVIGEGTALLFNLQACVAQSPRCAPQIAQLAPQAVSA
jgi:peptidoglycan biosynthesis protein MviN/MurJ (putative lipid II flippase)